MRRVKSFAFLFPFSFSSTIFVFYPIHQDQSQIVIPWQIELGFSCASNWGQQWLTLFLTGEVQTGNRLGAYSFYYESPAFDSLEREQVFSADFEPPAITQVDFLISLQPGDQYVSECVCVFSRV